MATPAPSSLFNRLANVWRDLSLRSDIDDILLELLGRFALEKVYAEGSGSSSKHAYQRLVISLLTQLNAIFYLQRLTLPADTVHVVGRYLGLLASWEVTVRTVELLLHVVADARDALWDCRVLRDKYLAEFLLSALRLLTLHPRPVPGQRARRERFARLHKALEQVFDRYPGDKSLLLLVARDVTSQLCADPDALALPPRLRYELPNLTSELYPLPECLSSQYISELVPTGRDGGGLSDSSNWLYEFLTLRDMSHFIVGASIQYAANQETRDVRLQSSSARSRNAVLRALNALRLPAHLPKPELVAAFNSIFRIILPDTLDLSSPSPASSSSSAPEDFPLSPAATTAPDSVDIEDVELDALDALGARLTERQIIHRVSDGEMMHGMSQVIREIVVQDNPGGHQHVGASRPNLHVLNCPECHLVGGAQLRAHDIQIPSNLDGRSCILNPGSTCPVCGNTVSLAREVTLARRTWEMLRPLETDAEAINVERHLPAQFDMLPLMPETDDHLLSPVVSYPRGTSPHHHQALLLQDQSIPTTTESSSPGILSPSPSHIRPNRGRLLSETSTYIEPPDRSISFQQDLTHSQTSPGAYVEKKTESYDVLARRKSEAITTGEKPKSRWGMRLPFSSTKKDKDRPATANTTSAVAAAITSGDSSSLSSGAQETQKLEEIPLTSLLASAGSKSRGKGSRVIHTSLSQNSTLALFWSQLSLMVWDLGTSPPTMRRAISTESTCILAAVARTHVAYILGTRDQKLTLRVVNLTQPSTLVVEYRMPSSPWCRSIAIDRNENYVAVGFEESVVRFFKTTTAAAGGPNTATPNTTSTSTVGVEHPREDRLHASLHDDCRRCPSVETLSFSHDGLALLASTRSHKTGYIQLYIWRFPFVSFHELTSCRYHVPLHESEDNGTTAALLQSGSDSADGNLVCITTWTQSGTPVLVQPRSGHKSPIRSDGQPTGGKQGRVGNRIQCAAFSHSGRELALVNDKGHLYQISHVNSSPLDIRRIATSKELTARSPWFSMGFMEMGGDEHAIVMAWADAGKGTGWVKKISIVSRSKQTAPGVVYDIGTRPDPPKLPQLIPTSATVGQAGDIRPVQQTEPAELAAEHVVRELAASSPGDEEGGATLGSAPGLLQYKR